VSKLILISRDDFLTSIEAMNSQMMARKALKYWDAFLKYRKVREDGFISDLKEIQKDPSFYQYLNLFVQYMINQKLHPHSVRAYFSSIKQYLRSQGFRIYNEDVKQFVKLPKVLKEKKYAITKEDIQKLITKASPRMKLLIICLVSSGMRANELLQLKFSDLKKPFVFLRAETTKTGVARTTFFSKQAWSIIEDQKQSGDYVFCSNYQPLKSLETLEKEFDMVRNRTHLTDRYTLSNVHKITIHRLRAFCKTQASIIKDKDYAEDLIGHEGYLSTYYNLTDESKHEIYKTIEPALTFRL
jgi:integrase